MSARTLQRRLAAFDRTFAGLVDEVRYARACDLLRDPGVSLAEVAFLLGFAEQSSFSRSFKRWSGKTPRVWRAEAL